MNRSRLGQLSIELLLFSGMSLILVTGFVLWTQSILNLSLRNVNKADAFSIAEAGIEYYRWHLAHAPSDYEDGTGHAGPYVHDYYNKNGMLVGTFTLDITPPLLGSTVVTVKSTGATVADTSVQKAVKSKFGIASVAKYAIAANDNMRFGTGTEIFGEVISNGGIRFDAIAHNIVKSAQVTYIDPDHASSSEFGVHTHEVPVDPLPPAAVPNRPNVFLAGRQFPVPAIDFTGLTQNLSNIKAEALIGGVYATGSAALGYDLQLNASGTYTLYRVTALVAPPAGCSNTQNQVGWGTWSIQSEVVSSTGPMPANGIFFIEDNLWVRGKIDGKRLTIASARFPGNPTSTRTNITVNNDLTYTNYNGTDVIGLIAQNNVNVGLVSNDDLRIDAALIAQNGRIGRYYYQSGGTHCGANAIRQKITPYGSIMTNLRYGFAYTNGTGYQIRNIIYDTNLLYSPPPSFPFATSQYSQIFWDEIK